MRRDARMTALADLLTANAAMLDGEGNTTAELLCLSGVLRDLRNADGPAYARERLALASLLAGRGWRCRLRLWRRPFRLDFVLVPPNYAVAEALRRMLLDRHDYLYPKDD